VTLALAAIDFATWFSALPFLLAAATITWLISLPMRNVAIVDALWSLMFFLAGVIYALNSDPRAPRLALVLWLLALWAARLAIHVTRRDAGRGEGRRYAHMRERNQPGFALKSLYLVFWLRALLAWVISLPVLGAFAGNNPIGPLDHAGVALWCLGMTFQVVGDWQLARFKKDSANADKVMDRGLRRYTRHPNYFGEFCVWWGFYCLASSAGAWWSVAGPLLITFLLLRVSGVRLPERDIGNRRPQYADYVLKTNAFFPGPPRK
jgi:steroid 5-alpha reductase family enzyme